MPIEIRPIPARTEVANGRAFTSEIRRYDIGRARTFYRIDGKLVAYADWIQRRRSCRRADEKAAPKLEPLSAEDLLRVVRGESIR